jgi:Tol biopolymer transport system component
MRRSAPSVGRTKGRVMQSRLFAVGLIGLTATALAVPCTAAVAGAAASTTTRVSVGTGGIEANGASYRPSVTDDGRYVAFVSSASNIIDLDHPGRDEIFIKDTQTDQMQRITVANATDSEPDGDSFSPAISADGRFVTYSSYATNLVPNDTNNSPDVFTYDRINGGTIRVSAGVSGAGDSGGGAEASISADGKKIAFSSVASDIVAGDTNNASDIFVWSRDTGKTIRRCRRRLRTTGAAGTTSSR